MRCIGRTKVNNRCKNTATYAFCKKHMWQPLGFLASVFCIVGFFAGLFQDLIFPIKGTLEKTYELKSPVSVRIERDRSEVADWDDKKTIFHGRSDVLTIFSDHRPVKSFEFYQKAKDQKFKNYPFTAKLYDEFIPTSIEYSILDLDGNGANEIVITLTNQLYGVHFDKQVNVLIFNAMGELLAVTPYPRAITELPLQVHSPYSAYKTTVVVKDDISGSVYTSTFCNGFEIDYGTSGVRLQFSWVVDNGSYASNHLHQVENYTYKSGKLIPVQSIPSFYLSESWESPFGGDRVTSTAEVKRFLAENNLPPMNELINIAKDHFK